MKSGEKEPARPNFQTPLANAKEALSVATARSANGAQEDQDSLTTDIPFPKLDKIGG